MPPSLKAKSEFILAIRKAKAAGVDVAGIFVEVHEYITLAWVRAFGLMAAIINVFGGPPALALFKIYCAQNKLNIEIPESLFYWFYAIGLISILAFGYDLVDPRDFLDKDKKKSNNISDSARFRKYEDDHPTE